MLGTQTTQKLKIGVFMGGMSIECEVSFNSGRTICDHLDTDKYEIQPIFQTKNGALYLLPWHFLHRGKITDFQHRLDTEATKITWDDIKTLVNFVYIAVHGRYAEDGTLQGMLDVLGIPYLGTKVFGSAIGMEKTVQKSVFNANGIGTAKGFVVYQHEIKNLTLEEISDRLMQSGISFPVIVKPSHEGSSLGISCATTHEELLNSIIQAAYIDERKLQNVIIEEKINGMEFVCVLLQKLSNTNGKITKEWIPLPLTQVIPEKNYAIFDYEQKYMPGRATKITPAPCTREDTQNIISTCIKASNLLDFSTISRIDGFLTQDGRVLIADPNTLTGMSPATFLFHQAAEIGMSHTELINFLIENELIQYGFSSIASLSHREIKEECTMNNENKKIRVAVLLGGDSNERETSLDSGRNICYKLSPQKYTVIPLFVSDNVELYHLSQKLLIKNSTREIAALLTSDMLVKWADLPTICDFVFIEQLKCLVFPIMDQACSPVLFAWINLERISFCKQKVFMCLNQFYLAVENGAIRQIQKKNCFVKNF
jgi:D-alanine-D-alanine ligase